MITKKAQAKQRNWTAMEATLRAGSARAPLYYWVVREKHLVREHFDQLTHSEQLDMLDQMCKWALKQCNQRSERKRNAGRKGQGNGPVH